MTSVQIVPSILAADFLRLGKAVEAVEEAGVRRLQIDVMDGQFVPNISVGIPIVQAIRAATSMLLEAHLMIVEPERYVDAFADAGADLLIVHIETSPHIYRTLQHIRHRGKQAGVALNPGTPWQSIEEVLHLVDLVLVMTVNPGFGGQEFLSPMLPKVRDVRHALDTRELTAHLEVDGGVDEDTAPVVVAAGADVLVAGTSVYGAAGGAGEGVRRLQAAIERSAEVPVE
jgi:ribulose-phosphate 3-epimerase